MNTAVVLIISVIAFAWLLYKLHTVIQSDGLGHTPPPRSHYEDEVRQNSVDR